MLTDLADILPGTKRARHGHDSLGIEAKRLRVQASDQEREVAPRARLERATYCLGGRIGSPAGLP